VSPPFIITERQIDELAELLEKSIREIQSQVG
jgi:adenosylmethionine-8-amino-7-oxononanoate aminotransferase